jgi:SAM-dependent methyltransferase
MSMATQARPTTNQEERASERVSHLRHQTLQRITASAVQLGRERLYPDRRSCEYLFLTERRKLFSEWLQKLPEGPLRVLDVGGRIQPYRALLKGREGSYIAVDPQVTGLVNVVAVGENLPLKDESVDLVLCTGMLCYAKDPVRVIAEIRRVLIPGGTLLLGVPAMHPYHAENDRWRFFPDGLRILLSGFSHVEIRPEGHSVSGFCSILTIWLDLFTEKWALRKAVKEVLIPTLNRIGEHCDRWCGSNISLTTSFSAFAQK